MSAVRITPAPAEAAALLAALHGQCFPEDPWSEAAMRRLLALPACFAHVAAHDGEPCGFALALDLGGECEVLALGVVPTARRRGTGRALLDALCRTAGARGAAALLLEVASDNAAARALYDTAGFLCIGRRPGYYRRAGGAVAALVLRRPLGEPRST